MIELKDLCSDLVMIPDEHKEHLLLFLPKLQQFEQAWKTYSQGVELIITSPYRFIAEHVAIYNKKNELRKKKKLKPLPIPLGSKHLSGDAVDFADPNGKLKEFVCDRLELMEDLDFYFEAFKYTPTWVHVQQVPPQSHNRFFIPY